MVRSIQETKAFLSRQTVKRQSFTEREEVSLSNPSAESVPEQVTREFRRRVRRETLDTHHKFWV